MYHGFDYFPYLHVINANKMDYAVPLQSKRHTLKSIQAEIINFV